MEGNGGNTQMDSSALIVTASVMGHPQSVVLDQGAQMVLRGGKLACPQGRVIAERAPDWWQSPRGRHDRIVVQGEVKLRFEAPFYQFDMQELFDEVAIVGGTLWNQSRELVAFYDPATDRWRDADNQQWTAIHMVTKNSAEAPKV